MIDASVLFPSERPVASGGQAVASPAPAATTTAAQPTAPASDAPKPAVEVDAAKLFNTEAPVIDRGAVEKLDGLAESWRMSGDTERATELREASDFIMSDALANGMPSQALRDIMGHLHEASGNLKPQTPEELQEGMVRGYRELADVPVSDIDLARGFIAKMSERIPSLRCQLEATGLGNDPAFIRKVVAESKRRAGR